MYEEENAVAELASRGYPEHHAREYVRRRGRCTYCGVDVVNNRLGFATLQWDHLLPQAHYPEHANDSENIVLSCHLCNGLKRDYDPSVGEAQMLKDDKPQLIENARAYVGERRRTVDEEWRAARRIVLGLDGWPGDVS